MSPHNQNKIAFFGSNVRQHIIEQLKKAKYCIIIFESTPDLQEVKVIEYFIDFKDDFVPDLSWWPRYKQL